MDLSFWFCAEASSRGVLVKNDVPIRSSFKSQNRGTAILAVGQAGILPADNHRLKAKAATKSSGVTGTIKLLGGLDKEIIMRINACCYLQLNALISLIT